MPEICRFFGIIIRMYWTEHAPPHFHAEYENKEIVVSINDLKIMKGKIHNRAVALILEWANDHREELLADWELCRERKQPHKIKPL